MKHIWDPRRKTYVLNWLNLLYCTVLYCTVVRHRLRKYTENMCASYRELLAFSGHGTLCERHVRGCEFLFFFRIYSLGESDDEKHRFKCVWTLPALWSSFLSFSLQNMVGKKEPAKRRAEREWKGVRKRKRKGARDWNWKISRYRILQGWRGAC